MNTSPLTAILDDMSKKDPEDTTPDELVDRLARSIQERSTFKSVQIRCVVFSRGELQPSIESRVYGGVDPDVAEQKAPRLADLRLYGKRPVLGDLRTVSHETVSGPTDEPPLPLRPGEQCLVFRIRSDRMLAYVLMAGQWSHTQEEHIPEWSAWLPSILGITLYCMAPPEPGSVRALKDSFFEKLLEYHRSGETPPQDFVHVSRIWQQTSGADSASLWLYGSTPDQIELSAFATDDLRGQLQWPVPPALRTHPVAGKGALAYCLKTRRVVFMSDVRTWRKRVGDVEYSASDPLLHAALGSPLLVLVPLLEPDSGLVPESRASLGVIVLHYARRCTRLVHLEDALLLMGRLTALAVHRSLQAEQRGILVELNSLAQRHLARTSHRPAEIRNEYLKDLIALIQRRMNVRCISIFYRMQFSDGVQCIATTGLLDRRNNRTVPKEEVGNCIYQANEGLTGKCYVESRVVMSLSNKDRADHISKFVELRTLPVADDINPVLFLPISSGSDFGSSQSLDGGTKTTRALGVIRCSEHTSQVFQATLVNFNQTEVDTLGFIVDHVGPVLQLLEQRIIRESTISVLKHDLFAPLIMIRDTAARMYSDCQAGNALRQYDAVDTVACAEVALNLIDQLELDPASSKRYHRQPTFLEGEIIARLVNMLQHYARITKDITILYEPMNDIPRLMIDSSGIERALYNLLQNAIKYGQEGSTVQIRGRFNEEGILVEIANTGIGVEPSEEPEIFKPYYRSPRAQKASAQGVGLGLTIARAIMKAHGGDVRLTSRKNPTVFSLFFPKSIATVKEQKHYAG